MSTVYELLGQPSYLTENFNLIRIQYQAMYQPKNIFLNDLHNLNCLNCSFLIKFVSSDIFACGCHMFFLFVSKKKYYRKQLLVNLFYFYLRWKTNKYFLQNKWQAVQFFLLVKKQINCIERLMGMRHCVETIYLLSNDKWTKNNLIKLDNNF